MRIGKYLILLFVLALMPIYLSADKLTVNKNSDGGLVGDIVPIKLEAEVPSGSKIDWPSSLGSDPALETLELGEVDSSQSGELTTYSRTYKVSAYDSLIANIEELSLSYTRPGMDDPNFITAPGFTLTFTTVAVDTTAPIKDIKDIESIEAEDSYWWLWLLLVAIALGILVFFLLRKKKGITSTPTRQRVYPPDYIALKRLEEIQKEAIWKENRFKAHHTAISDTLKQYLEERFSVNATDMTTHELGTWMQREKSIPEELATEMVKWLETGDLIKFARYTPIPDENTQPIEIAKKLVQSTRPAAPTVDNTLPDSKPNQEEGQS